MKIAIIGTGAMGSVYAGLLADSGNEIWAIDLWKEHVDAIASQGLRVEGASGDRTVKGIRTSMDGTTVGTCDLVVIATKASGVGSAAQSAASMIGPDTLILTIQNGLGAGERIREHLDSNNILLGVAGGFGASIKSPGHVHHNGMELIRLGEMEGGLSKRVEKLAELWKDAGFNVKAFDDIQQLIWEKFICNVSFSAPCTVFDKTIGEVLDDPECWNVSRNCGLEAYNVGLQKEIHFSFDDPVKYIEAFGRNMPGARPSMLLDHMARRPSEIDAINGMVPVVAKEVGLRAPFNEALSAIVRIRERSF